MEKTVGSASIRMLKTEDVDEICKIYDEVTKGTVDADFKQLILENAERKENSASIVAELDGKIVGFMISYILPLGFGIEKSAWVATMAVHPRFMGQGIGAQMAEEMFRCYKSRGILSVYTSVRWDSTDMLSFFKTLGFDRSDLINLHKSLK